MVFRKDEQPKESGQYIFLEFKDSYDYCLLPTDETDKGRLMVYPIKPVFIDQFKFRHLISKVD